MIPDGDTDSKEELTINLNQMILTEINQRLSQLNSACCSDKSSSVAVSIFASSKAPLTVVSARWTVNGCDAWLSEQQYPGAHQPSQRALVLQQQQTGKSTSCHWNVYSEYLLVELLLPLALLHFSAPSFSFNNPSL
ncbi:hypothetical protein BLNAU_18159 [Blattamonas nauphoetae]|uniref:Uncharacterized protein n=1 Tax=Blattamonas nauphoetae TaxID=2049346 RepID=A0ABQ9X5G7_9EUKA|nr:hypothetical protein BLNAU_18159 [Blattamonas nauphoetae]